VDTDGGLRPFPALWQRARCKMSELMIQFQRVSPQHMFCIRRLMFRFGVLTKLRDKLLEGRV
jgi:hypothetical protein